MEVNDLSIDFESHGQFKADKVPVKAPVNVSIRSIRRASEDKSEANLKTTWFHKVIDLLARPTVSIEDRKMPCL